MKTNRNQKGFTLVELMIVVAIIGILAAIAIPNFRNYQMKAKTGEAKVNLGAIKTSMETYRAENNVYLAAAANPVNIPGANKAAWATAADWTQIGFAPSGNVYYSYAVCSIGAAAGTATDYLAGAWADLDASYIAAGGTAGPAGALVANVAAADAIFALAAQVAGGSTFKINASNVLTDLAPGIW
jgi:type IV pilus assembly protein PilA